MCQAIASPSRSSSVASQSSSASLSARLRSGTVLRGAIGERVVGLEVVVDVDRELPDRPLLLELRRQRLRVDEVADVARPRRSPRSPHRGTGRSCGPSQATRRSRASSMASVTSLSMSLTAVPRDETLHTLVKSPSSGSARWTGRRDLGGVQQSERDPHPHRRDRAVKHAGVERRTIRPGDPIRGLARVPRGESHRRVGGGERSRIRRRSGPGRGRRPPRRSARAGAPSRRSRRRCRPPRPCRSRDRASANGPPSPTAIERARRRREAWARQRRRTRCGDCRDRADEIAVAVDPDRGRGEPDRGERWRWVASRDRLGGRARGTLQSHLRRREPEPPAAGREDERDRRSATANSAVTAPRSRSPRSTLVTRAA